MHKPLHRIDLNLLVIFQILLQERSVTLTAKWLSISPSAVSKALAKLRVWFDDPLFVRSPQGLIPTPLTLSIEESLSDFINIGNHIAGKQNSETPKGVHFSLILESPLHQVLLNQFPLEILNYYPQSMVQIRNWEYNSLSSIIDGDADIAFLGREYYSGSKEALHLLPEVIDCEELFRDTPLVYVRKDHPLLKEPWNLETFLRYSHISTEYDKRPHWALDDILAEHGRLRNIAITYTSFEQTLFMISQPNHELITCLPGYCVHYISRALPNLVTLPLPLPHSVSEQLDISFILLWHKRHAYNSKVLWLRETIKNSVNQFMQKNSH